MNVCKPNQVHYYMLLPLNELTFHSFMNKTVHENGNKVQWYENSWILISTTIKVTITATATATTGQTFILASVHVFN